MNVDSQVFKLNLIVHQSNNLIIQQSNNPTIQQSKKSKI